MCIVAVDFGNITTIAVANDVELVTESRIRESIGFEDLKKEDVFEFEGKKFEVNCGEFENNLIKYEKENFLPLVYYSISKITNAEQIKLAIGIPAGQYNYLKDDLKKIILENNYKRVMIGDTLRKIEIQDVMVIPEGYAIKANPVMKNLEKGINTLVIDIGGGTTDIAEFDVNGAFTGGDSIKLGLLDLYRNTRKTLENKPYNLNISLEQAKKYFDGNLDLLNKDIDYKKEIMLEFLKGLINELKGNYPNLSNSNIVLVGGGAKKVYPTFKKLYPQTILVNDIMANAKGFYKIGEKKWQVK